MSRILCRVGITAVAVCSAASASAASLTLDFGLEPNVRVTHAHAFLGIIGDSAGPAGAASETRFVISPDFLPAVQNVFRAEFEVAGAPTGPMVAGIIGLAGASVVVSLDSSRAVALFEDPSHVGFETAFPWAASEASIVSLLAQGSVHLPGGGVHESIAGFFDGLMAADLLPAVQHGTLPAVQHPGLPIAMPNGALARFSDAQYAGDFTAVVPEPASVALMLIAAAAVCRSRRQASAPAPLRASRRLQTDASARGRTIRRR